MTRLALYPLLRGKSIEPPQNRFTRKSSPENFHPRSPLLPVAQSYEQLDQLAPCPLRLARVLARRRVALRPLLPGAGGRDDCTSLHALKKRQTFLLGQD